MPSYRICGLTIAAEMELPGVVPAPASLDGEDVVIRQQPVPAHLDAVVASGPVWEMDARRFLLRLPSIGRFLASDGRLLEVEPEADAEMADVLPFLLGTGLGALLHQRGGMVLHAATVAKDGRAYAFCGRSGMGKSTMAAALCQAGCTFVTDDMAAISLDDNGRPVVWPDGRQLKLFKDSIARCGLEDSGRAAIRSKIDKYYVDPHGTELGRAVPLAAIYLLRDLRPPLVPGIERLSPLDAAQTVLDQSYRLRLLLAMTKTNGHVALTAAILRQVPVFHLIRRRDLAGLAGTATEVQAHWSGLAG